MGISREALDKIVREHGIMPEFLRVASAFCEKVSDVEETYCMPLCSRLSDKVSESCYAVKYAQYNGRDYLDPWSIRQTAMYRQYHRDTGKLIYILISPYAQSAAESECIRLLQEAERQESLSGLQLGLHLVLLDDHMAGWRDFLNFYEKRIEKLTAGILGPNPIETLSAHAGHLAEFQFLESRILPLDTILAADCRALGALKAIEVDLQVRAQIQPSALSPAQSQIPQVIDAEMQHIEAFHAHARGILNKCQSAAQLVDRALNLKHQRIAQEQTELMTKLAESTVDDSATVSVITIITLIYLSFTVVGTIMGMPFFYLDPASKRLAVSQQFWIYIAVALPMTMGSVVYLRWKLEQKRKRHQHRRDLSEKH